MSVIKLTPRNLAGIEKLFHKQKLEIERKLRNINKAKMNLEAELEVLKDGEEWCQKVYKSSKSKRED